MMSRCRISNHKPRKGTETAPVRAFPFLPYCISNHKPRKGTETPCKLSPLPRRQSSHFKPQTPQGDGNYLQDDASNLQFCCISNHKPRKGTETQKLPHLFSRTLGISNHKPRKGTETGCTCIPCHGWQDSFQTTNPARGRKLLILFSLTVKVQPNFKPQTPQGDGNPRDYIDVFAQVKCISNHKPRKGTETGGILH